MTAAIIPQHNSQSSNFYKPNKITTDSMTLIPIIPHDTPDKPVIRKFVLEEDETEQNIFEEMKCESNRLHTFKDRWPVVGVTPESLSKAGFFYLQQEDKVQCPFCHIVISNWTPGDKPLREHIRNKPKCPFLLGLDVGNISMLNEKPKELQSSISQNTHSNSVTASFKPKHSRMADIKRRILTFSGWPLSKPEPQQLAECGLYYSGIGDVVTCFFCGGTLGNWEPEDDPWNEHLKFFPDCSFLAISKNKHSRLTKIQAPEKKLNNEIPLAYKLASTEIARDVIKQALDIFPESLVVNAVKNKSGIISSLQELCDIILDLEQSSLPRVDKVVSTRVNGRLENVSTSQDTLLCKVCMDRERGVVFQPCGHLVSCWNCSNLISDCPVCRSPILYKIRTYLS